MPSSRASRRVVVVGLLSLAIAVGIGRFAFTPMLPLMQADGLVTLSGGGALASLHFVGYLMGAVLAARLPVSPRTALRISLLVIGASTLGMGLVESFPMWLGLRWVAGLCSAFILVLVSNFYVKRLAELGLVRRQGWIFAGVGAGIAVAGLGAIAMMAWGIGSASGWQLYGVATLAAGIAVCGGVGPELSGTRPSFAWNGRHRSPLVWRVVVAYGAAGIGYIIPATYLPVMARAVVTDPLIFGWAWPIFGAAAFLSTLLSARLHARFSNRSIWIVSQVIMAVGLVLPALHSSMATIVIAGLCVGGTFMIVTMAGMKEAHRIAPEADVMRHIGAMTAAFATGQMAGPVIASALHGLTGGFGVSLGVTSVLLVATALSLTIKPARKEATAQ